MIKIKKFIPANFSFEHIGIELLYKFIKKDWLYANNGRSCLYHILKAYNIKKIMIPTYICATILEPIKDLNIDVLFYDLDMSDLNPSFESFTKLFKSNNNIDAVLVASMYGNSADLVNFEQFCIENKIILIDDAAQSIGAQLNNRYVGTFGNAGFFSFSPGKPLAGHLGAFFWTDISYTFKKKKNIIFSYLKWLYFKNTRMKIYENGAFIIFIFTIINKLNEKIFSSYYNDICKFEKKIIGGILYSHFNLEWKFRKYYIEYFSKLDCRKIRLIRHLRGIENNHKLVFVVMNKNDIFTLKNMLLEKNIFYINGYKPLKSDKYDLPNSYNLEGHIFELPIENDPIKMQYLYNIIKEFKDA